MKVMTFNTQHCKNYLEQRIDFEIMAKAILDCEADIVGLNEMRNAGEHPEFTDQVKKLAELTGMEHYYFAEAIDPPGLGPYGNGFLSKIPIRRAETIPIPDPVTRQYDGYYETRCVLKAELENGITVLVSHFGLNPDEKENAVRTVMETLVDQKCILMGDFNMGPEDPLLAPIRGKMVDTAIRFTSEQFSFRSDKPWKKIDFIFVSPDLAVEEAEIPPIVASDHRPQTATLRI